MSSSKAAFLFLPGAWCPGIYYHKVTEKLQALGHDAIYVDLPSVGKKDVAPELLDDITHVRSTATALLDAGKDLVIIGNSYGGFVANESCKTLIKSARKDTSAGELKHIILINSPLAQKGQSMKDLVGDQAPIPSDTTNPWIDSVPGDAAYKFLFGSLPEEEGLKYGAMIQAQSLKPLLEPLTFAAYEEIPATVVIGEKDLAYKTEGQLQKFDEAVNRGVTGMKKVVVEEGDHVLMLGFAEEVVRICLEVVG